MVIIDYNIMKKLLTILATAILSASMSANTSFVKVQNGHFIKCGKPYYYVGTNFWYGAILGSTGQGGNRKRLVKELDHMKKLGIDNLRILVGSDGVQGIKTKVEPTLQKSRVICKSPWIKVDMVALFLPQDVAQL